MASTAFAQDSLDNGDTISVFGEANRTTFNNLSNANLSVGVRTVLDTLTVTTYNDEINHIDPMRPGIHFFRDWCILIAPQD